MTTDYDAIVIGAGHNGLICATYLARSGLRTLLVESRDSVGGCASSESFGGATVNICNCDHITFRTTPIAEELRLAEHGLEYLTVDPGSMHMTWDGGAAWPTFRDVDRTLDAIGRTHPGEVDNYRRYLKDALPAVKLVFEAAAQPPSARGLIGKAIGGGGRGAATLLRWSRRSAADVIRSYFDTESLRAPAMGFGPIVWGISPETPRTGLGALTYAMRHIAGVGRPRGGSGSLPVAIHAAFDQAGGTLMTGATVVGIECATQRVQGVTLADGTSITARQVVSACDPHSTFLRWLRNPPSGAGQTIERWRATPQHDGYESKIDAVVSAVPRYRAIPDDFEDRYGVDPMGATMIVAPSLAETDRGARMIGDGGVLDQPCLVVGFPTVLDSTMASPGSHVMSLEVLYTPYRIPGGWPGSSEPQRWIDRFGDLVEPGWAQRSLGAWRAMTPDVYESEFRLPNGHATSFAGGPLAALYSKTPELTRYRTAVPGLYLTGAATFPGAGIWGASGRNCALTVLRDAGNRLD